MRSHVRISILTFVVAALVAALAPTAALGRVRRGKILCRELQGIETCGEGAKPPSPREEAKKGYRKAGGDVPFGVTDFEFNNFPKEVPIGNVKNIRVDVAPGVVTNPQVVPKCSMKDFTGEEVAANQELSLKAPVRNSTIIGKRSNSTRRVANWSENVRRIEGTVYNLEQEVGIGL